MLEVGYDPAVFVLPEPVFRVRIESRPLPELISGPLRRRLGGGGCGMMSFGFCLADVRLQKLEKLSLCIFSSRLYIVDLRDQTQATSQQTGQTSNL